MLIGFPRYLIGMKPDVNPGVLAISDSVIAYVCGHNVVLYDMETKTQRYILGVEGSQSITAIAIHPNKRYLAVCERAK
jgi:cilia- and flagella-associated protein 57